MTTRDATEAAANIPAPGMPPMSTGESEFSWSDPSNQIPVFPAIQHSQQVERWRGMVARYFRPEDIDKAMWVLSRESEGDPNAKNPTSGASGLFQHMPQYWNDRSTGAGYQGRSIWDPESNIAVAAALLYGPNGGWGHWEVTHDTQPYYNEWKALEEGRTFSGWVYPVAGAASPTGAGVYGTPRTGHTHQGWDINAAGWTGGTGFGAGEPVRAAQAGTVRYSASPNGGYILHVDHGSGWVTKYMHLGTKDGAVSPYAVQNGAQVQAGQVIGYMGDSGNPAPGAYHLHFEMWRNGSPVDPATMGLGTIDYSKVGQQQASQMQPQQRYDQAAAILGGLFAAASRQAAGGNKLTWDDVRRRRMERAASAGLESVAGMEET